jgi:hypothetical protein|tara:strand:+ start:266 stop:529 length:264 start_codon:yes stop_codon:yes gene_type:complete
MKLADFEFTPTQMVLEFGDKYSLSIINNGYGKDHGLYEIAVFAKGSLTEMPGITVEGDTVKGYLTEDEVNAIIVKMFTITGKDPVQV